MSNLSTTTFHGSNHSKQTPREMLTKIWKKEKNRKERFKCKLCGQLTWDQQTFYKHV
jgi:hypothetical protein